ncbi:anaerobic nitric oxide reductase transcription regulator [Vibrio orientalis CIP 102891 = ATCC 33934]|uniref:Anaerobic nitric oxide reductase transcription regulator n=1 Tax=Vibrio orientalis CIP 102891 = ATCC 33934 TaxID=675816 RepID=C9QF17_VIBOR|nr:nitric oxide reductase transcriptional regulator NorR [Vibrio orientalis]EEX94727.1 anaerobic nitric oxide reductase transcription regulator NorR [Vibrio orientalis CIP 102891 = ATCC 33934]EGU51426.1 anaerobic nitric oxide reductase transcription regulator [Vibrio orientalis CIP 102891 = ATCC 33934]
MALYQNQWLQVALDITSGISEQDRFERLLSTIRTMLKCDASALLLYKEQNFIPLAINGLSEDVLGRRFAIEQHPRFEAIARAGDVVRFPATSDLADPYDGLIPNHEGNLEVHACIGLPLLHDERLIGAITIDAFDPEQFNHFDDDNLRLISALASNSLHTALLMEKLEKGSEVNTKGTRPKRLSSDKHEIIGNSTSMLELKQHIEAVAQTDLSVLITGETGVGKELVAQSLYLQSHRNQEPFVYLNCAALPESVAESELFGHVKGAFTGAISNRKGKFELANKGTLFLDEVGELSLALQAKLLRALQYGDIQRVGDDRNVKVDVRIVAATNRILHEEVKAEKFRADLYHRLSVFPIFVPPLREREKDVILLAGFFAERCQHKLNVASIQLSRAIHPLLVAHPWEGNVRELEHTINRAAVIAKAESSQAHLTLEPRHFQFSTTTDALNHSSSESLAAAENIGDAYQGLNLKEATEHFKLQFVEKAYQDNDQKLSATAKQLGIFPANLHRLLKRLDLK